MNKSPILESAIRRGVSVLVLALDTLTGRTVSAVDWSYTAYTDRYNYPHGLAADHMGNVSLAGNVDMPPQSLTTWEFFLANVDAQGHQVWKQAIGVPPTVNSPTYSNCLQMAPNGSVLLTGRTNADTGIERGVVMNFDSGGNMLWNWQTTAGY